MKLKPLIPWFILSLLASSAFGQATFVSGLVPDWNQPNWHSVYGTNGGPSPPHSDWDAWCVPTSAANMIGHWEDALGMTNFADGLPFPQSVLWAAAPCWQDYQANGNMTNRGTLSALGTVDGLGWYLDTNRRGDPAHGNVTPFKGTQILNHSAGSLGLNKFLRDLGRSELAAYTHGASYADPQASQLANIAAGFAELQREINAGRTAITVFRHWNLDTNNLIPGMPPAGSPVTEADYGFDFIPFGPLTTNGAPFGEVWDEGGDAERWIGHAVTVVGYVDGADPASPFFGTNCVIVHDNWASTPRNVAVPMDANWLANTLLLRRPQFVLPTGPGQCTLLLTNTYSGATNVIEVCTNLSGSPVWTPMLTNVAIGTYALIGLYSPDAGFEPDPVTITSGIDTQFHRAQTFTVGSTGTVAEVALFLGHSGPGTGDLLFELRDVTNGVPTSNNIPPLAAVTVPATAVPQAGNWISVDVSAFAVSVNSGDVLAIVLYQTNAPGYSWYGSSNLYTGGTAAYKNLASFTYWLVETNIDYAFRMYLQPPGAAGSQKFYRAAWRP
jgi:hypothetical protein